MVGKILIVDGVATNRIVFKVALGEAFYTPVLACDGAGCLHLAVQDPPDLILLDLSLPDMPGIGVIRQLRANPVTRDVPILALKAGQTMLHGQQALLAGADDVLPKHGSVKTLLARIRNLLRGREGLETLASQGAGLDLVGFADADVPFAGQALISIVSDQSSIAAQRYRALAPTLTDRIIVQTREEALVDLNSPQSQHVPDVFVIESGTVGLADSLRMMSELRSRASTRHSAICIISVDHTDDEAVMAYDQGTDDLVDRPVCPDELAVRLRNLVCRKRREDQLRATVQNGLRLAMIDPLTGLHNRRYALPHLAAIAERAIAQDSIFAVMVVDLDRFKSVNDRFGHAAGDAVLVEVARRLQSCLRACDLLARIGGEEFLIALPDTSFEDALCAADRLCHAVEEHQIHASPVAILKVTVSIGLAVSDRSQNRIDVRALVDRADHALLQAKSEGRNKVTISKSAA